MIYVGETSHSIVERSREQWSSYRGGDEDNHMVNLSIMGSQQYL